MPYRHLWLPQPGEATGRASLCLGDRPRDWLFVGNGTDDADERLRAAVDGATALATDLSAGLVAFDITGGGARDLIAAATALDLAHPQVATATWFANVRVRLLASDPDCYRIIVERPLTEYLSDWLARYARQ